MNYHGESRVHVWAVSAVVGAVAMLAWPVLMAAVLLGRACCLVSRVFRVPSSVRGRRALWRA